MNERPMNTLYHYPLSPFSRKVRLSLAEKKIEVGLVEERYWEKDAEFMRRNPAGKVPILKMGSRLARVGWRKHPNSIYRPLQFAVK